MAKKNLPIGVTKKQKNLADFDDSYMIENFFNLGRRNEFLSYKPLHQRLSSKYINYDEISSFEDFMEKAVRFLTRTAHSLFGFVTEEKISPIITFNLESQQSYCGLVDNYIQIGTQILTENNIPYQDRVDICVAVIYHEFYHKRFTNRDIKESMKLTKWEQYYGNPKTKDKIEKLLPTKLHGILNNILEDRRIERLGAKELPGYVFTFERERRYALFLHSEKFIRPERTEGIVLDYLLTKILLPENETIFFNEMKKYVEKGLVQFKNDPAIEKEKYIEYKEAYDLCEKTVLDLKKHIEENETTILSDSWDDILDETNNLFALIPQNIREKLETLFKSNAFTLTGFSGNENRNSGDLMEIDSELLKRLISAMSEEIKKVEEEQKEEKKSKNEKTITEKIKEKDNFTPYTHYKIIEPQKEPIDTVMLSTAKGISKNIFQNLGFLDSKYKRQIESFELSEGEIDETDLYSIGFGNTHIFEEIDEIEQYSLDFGILLDESGSMRGRIREAKLAVLSLLLALKENRHINLFVYGHTANERDEHEIEIYKYYNSIERYVDWTNIFAADSRANNADGFAIAKVGDIMKKSKSKNRILIVVSDGQPAATGYGGGLGVRHTREQVLKLESEGFTVIQICMAHIENSSAMFTNFIPYEADGRFFHNLKEILIRKLIQFSDAI